jgi:hypothetical protein
MRNCTIMATIVALLTSLPSLFAQNTRKTESTALQIKSFDPHDLNGSWLGARGAFFGDVNSVAEPPLTTWAKERLLTKNISHLVRAAFL